MTPSGAAPGNTNPSDATVERTKVSVTLVVGRSTNVDVADERNGFQVGPKAIQYIGKFVQKVTADRR